MIGSASRKRVVGTVVAAGLITLALTTLVVLVGPGGLMAVWCVPTGGAFGLLVRPKAGVLYRVFALVVGSYSAYQAYALAAQLTGRERPYVLAVGLIVLAGGAWSTFQSRVGGPSHRADTHARMPG